MTLRGMLLDIDGTLLLSNDAHAHAWIDAFREFDYHDISFEQVQPLIGMGGDKVLAKVAPGLSDNEGVGKKITHRRSEIFLEKYAPQLQPASGARDLLVRLKDAGITLVIATSAKEKELEALLTAARIDDLIHHQATSDDAGESKPDPDIVQAALEKSGLSPSDVFMLGDTPYDIEAAKRSQVGAIAVRCGGHDDDLKAALAVYDHPADLLAHLDDSPIGAHVASVSSVP